jgi:beta-xylosidase
MPGDFSDLDVIRVGGDYYAISSTMQYSPGMAVLHSADLVNWTIIGHVVPDLSVIDPQLNWDRMNRAGRGIWAGAIRYHDNRFWVYFGTPDQGIFMSTSETAGGPWTPISVVLGAPGWDDPCPFWDDDGQGYLVATRFAPEAPSGTTYNVHLFRIDRSGDALQKGSDRIIHRSRGSEANKLYKIHGLYYHYYSEVTREGRVPMMERASSLNGPWESRQLMHVNPAVDKEPNQGGLVELKSGKWYFITHQGRGDWEGRAGVLLPVSWIAGWPIIGQVGSDGTGNMIWTAKKPILGLPPTLPAASDQFDELTLKPEWEWNYQPRPGMWSLTEHPGTLRMRAFPPLTPGDFHTIPNILTQRSFRTSQNQVTVKLDLSGMVDGQEVGLAHFAKTWCTLSLVQRGNIRTLQYNQGSFSVTGPPVKGNTFYFRSEWDFHGRSQFYYSIDGHSYKAFGDPYQLSWGFYRGDRIGLFTSNRKRIDGYIDIDSFEYRIQH